MSWKYPRRESNLGPLSAMRRLLPLCYGPAAPSCNLNNLFAHKSSIIGPVLNQTKNANKSQFFFIVGETNKEFLTYSTENNAWKIDLSCCRSAAAAAAAAAAVAERTSCKNYCLIGKVIVLQISAEARKQNCAQHSMPGKTIITTLTSLTQFKRRTTKS